MICILEKRGVLIVVFIVVVRMEVLSIIRKIIIVIEVSKVVSLNFLIYLGLVVLGMVNLFEGFGWFEGLLFFVVVFEGLGNLLSFGFEGRWWWESDFFFIVMVVIYMSRSSRMMMMLLLLVVFIWRFIKFG